MLLHVWWAQASMMSRCLVWIMQIQDDISPRQKVTCRKGGSELSSLTSKPEQTRAPEHRPEHWPGAVLELSWLLNCSQSLQSFGSGCLQLSKTLPRHGSGINKDHCQQEAWSWLLCLKGKSFPKSLAVPSETCSSDLCQEDGNVRSWLPCVPGLSGN